MLANLKVTEETAPQHSNFMVPQPHTNLSEAREDYNTVSRVISYCVQHSRNASGTTHVAEIIEHIGHSEAQLEALFQRWAGLDTTTFLAAVTTDHARNMLRGSVSLLQMSHELGLDGPARLHDLLIDYEVISTSDLKQVRDPMILRFGFHDTPFGLGLIVVVNERICGLGFCNDTSGQNALIEDMMSRWPHATYEHDPTTTLPYAQHTFTSSERHQKSAEPVKILLMGTEFELRVWEALLEVPVGRAVTYSDLAEHLGNANANRAVGSAVGRNPISFVVPCHRVLRKDASLGGYHWGLERKLAMHCWEAGRMQADVSLLDT